MNIPGTTPFLYNFSSTLESSLMNNALSVPNSCAIASCQRRQAARWYTNPNDFTTKICQTCYIRIKAEEETAKGTTCANTNCRSQNIKRWYNNPNDSTTKLCSTCYRRIQQARLVEREAAQGTICANANCTSKKIKEWCKNPEDPTTKICGRCYKCIQKAKKVDQEVVKGTTCANANCTNQNIKQWYMNPEDSTTKLCNRCYGRVQRAKTAEGAAAKEIICANANCTSQIITLWRTNPNDSTTNVCHACYMRLHRAKKAGKEAIFTNSSQASAERGKTKSKRRGLNAEGVAKAMSDEEDQFGKATAGRAPDKFMKIAEKEAAHVPRINKKRKKLSEKNQSLLHPKQQKMPMNQPSSSQSTTILTPPNLLQIGPPVLPGGIPQADVLPDVNNVVPAFMNDETKEFRFSAVDFCRNTAASSWSNIAEIWDIFGTTDGQVDRVGNIDN